MAAQDIRYIVTTEPRHGQHTILVILSKDTENPNGKFLFIQIMTLIVKLLKVSTDPVGGFED